MKIKSDCQGTITLHRFIDVHFVPQSTQSSKPAIGDTVSFYLPFDWHGPRAWSVVRCADSKSNRKTDYSESSDSSDEDDGDDEGKARSLDPVQVHVPPLPPRAEDIHESGNMCHGYQFNQVNAMYEGISVCVNYYLSTCCTLHFCRRCV